MARPRRRVEGGRSHRVRIRLSDDEAVTLNQAAAAVEMTPAGYTAEAALLAATGDAGLEPGALYAAGVELQRTRTELARVGNNLNQAVTKLHALGVQPGQLVPASEACARAIAQVHATSVKVARAVAR